jgi:iron complex transport system ATP-binding protein
LLTLVRNRCDQRDASALVVTHDLNLAAQFSDHILLMKNGRVIEAGPPRTVLTPELLRQVFEVTVLVDAHPVTNAPRVTPVHGRRN